jgi:glycosyltransferase involved in cell wall biosynthesis
MATIKLLVATRHSPLPENDGSGAYLFDLLSYLRTRGVEIEIAWLAVDERLSRRKWWTVPSRMRRVAHLSIIGCLDLGPWRYFHWGYFKAQIGEHVRLLDRRRAVKSSSASTTLPTQIPSAPANTYLPRWSDLPTTLERRFFQKRLARFRPDAVLVNYCWLAPLLEGLPAATTTAVLTCDVISQRIPPSPGLVPDPGTPEGEATLLRMAQHALAISEDDAAIFRTRLPHHSIVLAPKAASAVLPHRLLFVGGANEFNREGLAWFLQQVWPQIHRDHPAAELHICGAIGESVQTAPVGVIVKGRVPDLTAEYAAAAVVIVPLLRGSGVKIKLVEAASFGKAIVTTPVGLQGLSFLRDGVREVTAAEEFASAVVGLLRNPAERDRLARLTIAAAGQHLSPEGCYEATYEVLCKAARPS